LKIDTGSQTRIEATLAMGRAQAKGKKRNAKKRRNKGAKKNGVCNVDENLASTALFAT
jgi:hypothetical protein